MLNWYAVYVNVKHEKKVVHKLTDKGIEAYTPFVKKMQQWSDRKKMVEFPMLSGYVFVNIKDMFSFFTNEIKLNRNDIS